MQVYKVCARFNSRLVRRSRDTGERQTGDQQSTNQRPQRSQSGGNPVEGSGLRGELQRGIHHNRENFRASQSCFNALGQ